MPRAGYCNEATIGDDETPASAGAVNVSTAVDCRPPAGPPQPQTPVVPTPPPAPPPSPQGLQLTARLEVSRLRILRSQGRLDVLAPISSRASGRVRVALSAAGRRFRFTAPVAAGRIRFGARIPRAQARLGTGIVTIFYPGDADTRQQEVRLRAAARPADLRVARPTITNGRVRTAGTVTRRARGVVGVQLEYVHRGVSKAVRLRARITAGRWSLDQRLSSAVLTEIAARTGTVHSYTSFTGDFRGRVRGELRAHQVLPDR